MDSASIFAQTKKYFKGYRKRIIICMIFFLLAIFVPLVLYGIITDRAMLAKNVEGNGRYLVANLAENSELGVFSENAAYLKAPVEAILKENNAVWAAVYNSHGEIILSAQKLKDMDLNLPGEIKNLIPAWQKDQVHKQVRYLRNRKMNDFFLPVYLKSSRAVVEYEDIASEKQQGQLIGIARVGMSLEILQQRTLEIIKAVLVLIIVCLVAGGIAILFVARSITRPLRQLEAGARAIGKGNLGMRIDSTAEDEIGSLARSFNDMADQLQQQMLRRQNAEDEMRRLISAVEQAAEMIIVMDCSGTIKYVNPAAERITGFQVKEILGKNPFSMRHGIYDTDFSKDISGKVMAGETWAGLVSEIRKDGSLCKIEQTITPVRDNSGKIVSFVSIGRDITNEQFMEEQLRQSQKLKAIGTLAGGIAHDFNNILGAIIGYTELSLDAGNLEQRIRHNLEQILKSSLRAANLVKQILAFSRKSIYEQQPVQLNLIIQEAFNLLRPSIPRTVAIRQHLPDDEIMIVADPTQILQVLMNLCTNAAQAMSGLSGAIDISLSSRELHGQELKRYPELQKGRYAQLTVHDTGPGIAPDILEHIFEPFFTTKEVGKGTGMGLSVVDGIVRSHGGAIKVYSEPARGATFEVLFPQLEAVPDALPQEEQLLPTGAENILFIDDEDFLVDSGRKMLSALGYRVTVANGSFEAFEIFQQTPDRFDLVITDQTMPQMTGYELARNMLQIRPSLPVILCTGYSETVSPETAAAGGIKAFIYKPVGKQELAIKIREVLDKKNR